MNERIIKVARGLEKADLVIKNANIAYRRDIGDRLYFIYLHKNNYLAHFEQGESPEIFVVRRLFFPPQFGSK